MAYGMLGILRSRGVTDLPIADYSRDIGDIYRQLTSKLHEVTGSLDFLFFAAAGPQPGLPSWVPDWSANSAHQWLIEHDAGGVDHRGLSISSEDAEWLSDQEKHGHVLCIDQASPVLDLQAIDLGSISTIITFRRMSKTYVESEAHLHLANLQSMLLCATWTLALDPQMTRRLLSSTVAENVAYANGKTQRRWSNLNKRFAKKRRGLLEKLLQDRADNRRCPRWFLAEFLPCFIEVCNSLARAERVICRATMKVHPSREYMTACDLDTRVGDRILRIRGLALPLVVRELNGRAKSVQIVSPMKIEERGWWAASDEEIVDGGFVDYHIH